MGEIEEQDYSKHKKDFIMKATHLITLSARIEELRTLYKGNKITLHEFYDGVIHYKSNMSSIITLSKFVACKNGVPLEKPKGKNPKRSIWQPYNEAQKSVIFEGWEVVRNEKYRKKIKHLSSKAEIVFENGLLPSVEILNAQHNWYPIKIQSLADLAAATQLNPLKLKLK